MLRGLILFVLGLAALTGSADAQTTYRLAEDDRGTWIRGFYPLYDALARGDLEAVRRLTPAGEGINGHGEAGATPLSWFLTTYRNTTQDQAILQHLLEHGADPNGEDALLEDGTPQGCTVYRYAARLASAWATQQLLDHGMTLAGDDAREALLEAAAYGNIGFLSTLEKAGLFTTEDLAATPALAAAAIRGEMAAVRYLLARGAGPDEPRLDGLSPLHWAVLQVRPEIVALLLDAGADPSVRSTYPDNPTFDGKTALELAEAVRSRPEEADVQGLAREAAVLDYLRAVGAVDLDGR